MGIGGNYRGAMACFVDAVTGDAILYWSYAEDNLLIRAVNQKGDSKALYDYFSRVALIRSRHEGQGPERFVIGGTTAPSPIGSCRPRSVARLPGWSLRVLWGGEPAPGPVLSRLRGTAGYSRCRTGDASDRDRPSSPTWWARPRSERGSTRRRSDRSRRGTSQRCGARSSRTAGRSRSTSVTPSWPSSGCRPSTKTMPCVLFAPRSTSRPRSRL